MKYRIFYRKSLVLLVTSVSSIALLIAPAGFVVDSGAKAAGAGHGYSDQRVTKTFNATWSGDTAIVGSCENGFLLMLDIGPGYSTHMGKSMWSSTYCTDPVTWNGSGIGVATGADGDEIRFQITLHFIWNSSSGGNWTEEETAIGGTGRFAGATGSSTSSGTFTMTSATTAVWEGTTTGKYSY